MVLSPMNKKLQTERHCWEGDNTGQINSLKGYLHKQRKYRYYNLIICKSHCDFCLYLKLKSIFFPAKILSPIPAEQAEHKMTEAFKNS